MQEKIKALIIGDYGNLISKRSEAEIFIGLKKAGVEVEIITFPDSPLISLFSNAGIKVLPHHPTRKIQLSSVRFIRKTLKEGGHNIIHLFNSKAIANGIIASIGLPVKVITYRGAKGPYWHDPSSYLTHFHPRVDSIICLSNYVRNSVVRQKVVSPSKLHVVYKRTNLEWYENISPFNFNDLAIPDSSFIVTCIANLRPVKGVEYFVGAAAYLKDLTNIHFVIIGAGTDSPVFKRKISRLPNAENIHVLGYQNNILPHLAASHIFVLPSVSEGLSRTVIEAMAMGTPIVSTACGGPEEMLTEGYNGVIVPVRNPKAISEAILKLYNKPELRKKLGNNAQSFLREQFSIDKTVEETLDVYKKVLKK